MTLFLLTLLSCCSADPAGIQETRYLGTLGTLQYEFRMTAAMWAKSPAWRADQEHPPLGPRKALAAADKVLENLLKDYPLDEASYPRSAWGLNSIELSPAGHPDRWIWNVRYRCQPLRAALKAQELTIPVLMDGTAVEPSLRVGRD